MKTKAIVCEHCQAVNSHQSFQCYTQRKPIKKKTVEPFSLPSKPKLSKNQEKSLKELKELTQKVVNKYIRNKYSQHDNTTRCFTCLKWVSTKQIDASHYISVRHQATRFDLDNLRSTCQDCNRFKAGNLLRFRQHLVQEIGESVVEQLEMRSKQVKHWTKEELYELISKYK